LQNTGRPYPLKPLAKKRGASDDFFYLITLYAMIYKRILPLWQINRNHPGTIPPEGPADSNFDALKKTKTGEHRLQASRFV
jgi:hypothetical protein